MQFDFSGNSILGPRGRPARSAPQARRFSQRLETRSLRLSVLTFSRFELIAGGTPAVPVNAIFVYSSQNASTRFPAPIRFLHFGYWATLSLTTIQSLRTLDHAFRVLPFRP